MQALTWGVDPWALVTAATALGEDSAAVDAAMYDGGLVFTASSPAGTNITSLSISASLSARPVSDRYGVVQGTSGDPGCAP